MSFKKCCWCLGLYDEFMQKFRRKKVSINQLTYTASINSYKYIVTAIIKKQDCHFKSEVIKNGSQLVRPRKHHSWEEAYDRCFYHYLEIIKETLIKSTSL